MPLNKKQKNKNKPNKQTTNPIPNKSSPTNNWIETTENVKPLIVLIHGLFSTTNKITNKKLLRNQNHKQNYTSKKGQCNSQGRIPNKTKGLNKSRRVERMDIEADILIANSKTLNL